MDYAARDYGKKIMTTQSSERLWLLLILGLFALIFSLHFVSPPPVMALAPGDVNSCTSVRNLSNSPGYTSVDPLLLASPDGSVHLFWAERIYGEPDAVPNVPDALVYASWNGASWSQPIDIFLSPRERFNKRINGIRGILDHDGNIHLIWIGPDNLFFYSSAHSTEASMASAWRKPLVLANDQSGTQYSVDITHSGSQTLHIVYGQENLEGPASRSVRYIRSDDGGLTWSLPRDIYLFPQLDRGPSNVRIVADEAYGGQRLYATWTEWDGTGNGQAIYFARSLDGGDTWEDPVVLDRRVGGEYERDWVTLAVLGEDELIVFWEGGWRAYRQAQYSYDGGESWTEPIDTLDWLIADNGFAEFLRDSTGRLHLFVFQRVREGNDDKGNIEGLWHTTLDGKQDWREPQLVGNPSNGNFVSVAISGGNELFASWFDYTNFDIYVRRCQIEGAPAISPQPWIRETSEAVAVAGDETPTATPPAPVESGTGAQPVNPTTNFDPVVTQNNQDPLFMLVIGIVPALLLVVLVLAWYLVRQQLTR